jgi:hypothetical protein
MVDAHVRYFPIGTRARDGLTIRSCSNLNKSVFSRPRWYFGAGMAVACPKQVE